MRFAKVERSSVPRVPLEHQRKFHTLDGLRGVAALLVVARHVYQFGVFAPESFLAVYRLIGDRRHRSTAKAWSCLIVLGLLLVWRPPAEYRLPFEFGLVFVALPSVVFVGCSCDPAGRSEAVFRFLGVTSYGVYVLHAPVGMLTVAALKRAGVRVHDKALFAAFALGLLAIVWALDKWYDAPLRRWLRSVAMPERSPPPIA